MPETVEEHSSSAALPGLGEDPDESEEREGSGPLLVAVLAAATAVAVAVALLAARGGMDDVSVPETAGEAVRLTVTQVTASSALAPAGTAAYGPDNLIDDDASTAWNEDASGDGTGEWVELELAEPARVTRLLVWNGHQKGALFAENNRVRTLRIDLSGAKTDDGPEKRTFDVELLDARGAQAVDLPEPVPARRIRLTVEDVYPGARYNDAALSEVKVLGLPSR